MQSLIALKNTLSKGYFDKLLLGKIKNFLFTLDNIFWGLILILFLEIKMIKDYMILNSQNTLRPYLTICSYVSKAMF